MITGILTGIGAAVTFSLAAILYRLGLKSSETDVLLVNSLRAPPALATLYLALLISGEPAPGFDPLVSLYAFLSMFFALIIGDIAFFEALKRTSVSIVYPIAYSFSLPATLFTYLLTKERVTWGVLYSSALIVTGITLTYLSPSGDRTSKLSLKGLTLSLMTSTAWGASVVFTKLGLLYLNPIPFNIIRLWFMMILLPIYLATTRGRREAVRLKVNEVAPVVGGGILGIGLGPLLFFVAIGELGASKASVLTSSSPVLTALLSSILLREKLSLRQLLGIVIIVIGIYLLRY